MPREQHLVGRRGRLVALTVATTVLTAACGGSDSSQAATTVVSTTAIQAATSTAAPTTTPTDMAFTETSDMLYRTVDGVELLMDVYVPESEGPWPVVVAFHGLDSRGKDSQDNIPIAEAAATEGMLVFAPSWIVWDPPPFPFTTATFDEWRLTVNCAVAYAQQNALALGGDPDNTIIYGFSGGGGAGLIAAVEPVVGPLDGCETDASPTPPTGAVLGDAVYFLHNADFDPAFEANLEGMQSEVARLVDPAEWPQDMPAKFRLWVAGGGTNPRTFTDPADEAGWLAMRDPSGSIRTDLEALGQLDDNSISTVDAGELLAFRLTEAGIDATVDEYPGGHTVANKVDELIGYLKDVAGL